MKSIVYFHPLPSGSALAEQADAGKLLLQTLLDREHVELSDSLPIKVHFGEKGNRTYLPPEIYDPVISFLQSRNIDCCFIETSVLYGGERFKAQKHINLAHKHGFTRIPVVIADGEQGEKSVNVTISGGKHFKSAAVAEKLADASQVLVVSHFKGHMLAGFGGALKQLSMGFASKGGKMAMHLSVTPKIRTWKCKKCGLCLSRCNEHAITIGKKVAIDPEKCVGCGACFSICPRRAITVFSLAGIKNMLFGRKLFREKLMEYAKASHSGKRNIYLSFAINITPGCDCEPRRMSPCIPDIGVFASLDPVALDAACYDAASGRGKSFKGREQLSYAEKIGVGSMDYRIIEV